ncbi:unnamed protein product, partial [Effrenium voratum]
GESLGFTQRHVDCCFPELKGAKQPAWMKKQIDQDFRQWQDQVFSGESLTEQEAQWSDSGTSAELCRFSIRKSGIFHCDFGVSRFYSLLNTMLIALHILHVMFGLPEMDFLVHTSEYYGVGSPVNLSVPVLVQAQPAGCRGILIPWWAFLQWDWTRRYRDRLEEAASKPWPERRETLFWRGSDTGCLAPSNDSTSSCGLRCTEWTPSTWPLFPRSKLVLASSLFPGRIDALFTKDTVHRDCQEVYATSGLWIDQIIAPEAHVHHKYLAYADGSSFSDRLYWLLLTGSLVFKAMLSAPPCAAETSSRLHVWLDGGLLPWDHYVPVREDLADLLDRLDWAKQNDEQSARIAAEAGKFARSSLTLEGSLLYLYQVLSRLGQVIRLTRDELAAEIPRRRGRSQASEELDCWALGFTPDFCCDLELGPSGNADCWAGPYSFTACCRGPTPRTR